MALTRITKGVIKPNENYDTHNINSTGIVTATKFVGPFDNINVSGAATFTGNVTIGGTLTYEDVTNVDSVGIVTALGFKTRGTSSDSGATNSFTAGRINIYDNNSHNIFRIGTSPSFAPTIWQTSAITFTASSFSVTNTQSTREYININNSTGILKLGYGAPTADHGFKFETSGKGIKVGTGVTIETSGQANFAGITTISGTALVVKPSAFPGATSQIKLGYAEQLKFRVSNANQVVMQSTGAYLQIASNTLNISRADLNLTMAYFRAGREIGLTYNYVDRLVTSGVGVTVYNQLDTTNLSIAGVSTFTGNIDANGDLDVDGHTNLDNVNIAGVTTAVGNIRIANNAPSLIFDDQNHSVDYTLTAEANAFKVTDNTNGDRLIFSANGSTTMVAPTFVMTGGAQVSSNLGVTGNITLGDSIIHNADTDTKIRFPANDTIRFETAGSQRLNINSTGNISITNDLDVDGHTNLDNVSIVGITTTTSNIEIKGDNKYLKLGASDQFAFVTAGSQSFITDSTGRITQRSASYTWENYAGNTEYLRIASNGRVGINTDNPQTYLYSMGEIAAGDGNRQFIGMQAKTVNGTPVGEIRTTFYSGASGAYPDMRFVTRDTERLRIDSNGRVLIGGGSSPTQVGDGRLIVYADTRLHPAIKADCIDGGSNRANGFTMLADNYQADESLSNIGLSYSGAGLVISRGVKVSNASDNVYLSSTDTAAQKPTAFKLDNGGNFTFLNTDTSAITTTDSAVTLYEKFRIHSDYLVTVGNNDISSLTQPSKLRIHGSYVNNVGPFGILEFKNRDNSGGAVCSIRGVRDNIQGGNYSAGLTFHTNGLNPASASDGDYERLRITSDGKIGINDSTPSVTLETVGHNQVTFGSMPETIITYGTTSAYNSGSAGSGIQFGGKYNSGGEYTIFAGVHGVKSNTQNGPYGGALIFSVRQNNTSSFERMRVSEYGTITNTTASSHSQGAGTFNIKGVINQYSQGSGSGLIFDCDFGRLTGYGDDTNVTNGTNLSACLAHSTTDWTSSSSNTPISVDNGTFQYRVGFGGYMEGISNGGRVSVGAGSGNPAMSDKLNTAAMTIESWVWYSNGGREVICSRWGSGFPNQFNMICDPDGQFHYNNSGAGAGSGNISGEHFPAKTWHHHVWQYDNGNNVNRWYINGAFVNSRSHGSSLALASNTGFGIFSRADDYERWRGKIAVVRIYNRALSATEIKNHFELERGRFGV